jgi:hypothetical protein
LRESPRLKPTKEYTTIDTPHEELYSDSDLGYKFFESESEQAPGYARLDIVILEHPSEAHFDPERVELGVVSKSGGVEHRSITHPWPWSKQTKATPGFVTLRDRKDKYVEAFIFGGTLSVQLNSDHTHCSLTSDAPILNLNQIPGVRNPTISYMLAMQAQILLARRRAAWVFEPTAFLSRLAVVEPLEFYGSCIRSLIAKFTHYPTSKDTNAQEFLNFLHDERERIRPKLMGKEKLPTIEDIL